MTDSTEKLVAEKIKQTRDSIAALVRQREGVDRQIEIQNIKLKAYQELLPDEAEEHDDAQNGHARAALFTPTIPWERVFAAIRETVKDRGEFGTADIHAQLGLANITAPGSTVRSKLSEMVADDELIRIDNGRFKFAKAKK
jgi:hypothetical protein